MFNGPKLSSLLTRGFQLKISSAPGGVQPDPDGAAHGVPGGAQLEPDGTVQGVPGGVQLDPDGAVHGVPRGRQLEPGGTARGVPGGEHSGILTERYMESLGFHNILQQLAVEETDNIC